jgi:hypothetical protein
MRSFATLHPFARGRLPLSALVALALMMSLAPAATAAERAVLGELITSAG